MNVNIPEKPIIVENGIVKLPSETARPYQMVCVDCGRLVSMHGDPTGRVNACTMQIIAMKENSEDNPF
jgi:hypothetical protein